MVVGAVVAHPLNIRLAQARFGTGPEDASPSSVSPWESHVGFRLLEEALAHHRLGAQGFDEVGGVGDPSEHPLQDEERGVVSTVAKIVRQSSTTPVCAALIRSSFPPFLPHCRKLSDQVMPWRKCGSERFLVRPTRAPPL